MPSFTVPQGTFKLASIDIVRDEIQNNLEAPKESFAKWQTDYYNTDIETSTFVSENHDLYTGKSVYFVNQNIPSPFLNDTLYYSIVLSDNTFRLANSLQEALAGQYVRFNVNDSDRPGVYNTAHNAIPICYVTRGEGFGIAQRLANKYNSTFDSVNLYFKHVVFGPTETKNQEDLQMMFFDTNFLE